VKPYRIRGDRFAREAWMYLGKAREAKFRLGLEKDAWSKMVLNSAIRDLTFLARRSMQTAILYRQMNEVL
jgi:hypothetical protein